MGWLDKGVSTGYMRKVTSTRLYMGDIMIEIGSLVKYVSGGDIGMVYDTTLTNDLKLAYMIRWSDGTVGILSSRFLEKIA
jgi:hypothetical protein